MKPLKILANRALGRLGYQVTKSPKPSRAAQPKGPAIKSCPAPEAPKTNGAGNDQSRNFRKKFVQYAQSHKTVKLHFGCGPRVLKDWVNIDLAFEPYQDYLKYYKDTHYPRSIRGTKKDFYAFDPTLTPLPIPDDSVDVIFHEDFFEHISQRDQVAFLAETRRVLKKGGIHRVNTPDLVVSMRRHSDFSKGFSGTYFEEWDKHQHLNVISQKILKEMALLVGYSKIVFNQKNKSLSKLIPKEYRPDPHDRPANGNVFADLIK